MIPKDTALKALKLSLISIVSKELGERTLEWLAKKAEVPLSKVEAIFDLSSDLDLRTIAHISHALNVDLNVVLRPSRR